jgi:hypothetical protein
LDINVTIAKTWILSQVVRFSYSPRCNLLIRQVDRFLAILLTKFE